MTGRESCEWMARRVKRELGVELDPKWIWEYSPTGELTMVIGWYQALLKAVEGEDETAIRMICQNIVDVVLPRRDG